MVSWTVEKSHFPSNLVLWCWPGFCGVLVGGLFWPQGTAGGGVGPSGVGAARCLPSLCSAASGSQAAASQRSQPAGLYVPGPLPALARPRDPSLAVPPGQDLRPWPHSGSFWSREKMGERCAGGPLGDCDAPFGGAWELRRGWSQGVRAGSPLSMMGDGAGRPLSGLPGGPRPRVHDSVTAVQS